MKLEDISKETVSAARRVLAGGAIAAVAVFGVAACEDTSDEPGMENQEGEDEGDMEEPEEEDGDED